MHGPDWLGRSWRARVAVRGHSMAPSLREGDWLLVDPEAYRTHAPRPGELVLADAPAGLIVKRLVDIAADGSLVLEGDAPSDEEHRHDATVPPTAVMGRPWFRYWPLRTLGRVR